MSNLGGPPSNGRPDQGDVELDRLRSELADILDRANKLVENSDLFGAKAAFEAAIPLIDRAIAFPLTPARSVPFGSMLVIKARSLLLLMPDRCLTELSKGEERFRDVLGYLETAEVADSQSEPNEFIALKAELHQLVAEMALNRVLRGEPQADDINIAIQYGELSRQEYFQVGDREKAAGAAATAGGALYSRVLRTAPVSTIAETTPSLTSVDDRIRAIRLLGEAWDQIRDQLPVSQVVRIGLALASCYVSSVQIADNSRFDRVTDILEIVSPLVDRSKPNHKWFRVELLRCILATEADDFDEAIQAGMRTLRLAKQLNDSEIKIEGLGGLGRACVEASRVTADPVAAGRLYRRGRRYLESAVREAQATGSPSMHAGIVLGVAMYLFGDQFAVDIRHIRSVQQLLDEAEKNPVIRANPLQYFLAARMLGLVLALQHRWDDAALHYTRASMIQQQVSSSSVAIAAGTTAAAYDVGFAEEFAYVFAQMKKPQFAIGVLEGRSRLLRHRFLAPPPWLQRLTELDPELSGELMAQLREIDDLRSALSSELLSEATGGSVEEKAYSKYLAAIDRFQSLIRRVHSVLGSDAQKMTAFSDRQSNIMETLVPGEALVYYTLSTLGHAAIVVRWMAGSIGISVITVWLADDQPSPIFPQFDAETSGWEWSDESLHSAGRHYVEQLAAYLRESRVKTVYIVPSALGLPTPLHCLTYDTDSGRRRLIDEFDVSYVPFGEAIVTGKAKLHRMDCTTGEFIGIACIPDEPSFAYAEVRHASQMFRPTGRVVPREEATVGNCTELSRSALVFHIACHGGSGNNRDPAPPCLKLVDGSLTDVDILEGPTMESARLVVLAACDSAQLAFFRGPNESMSIANCYLTAGAVGVIATLQPVDDFAACIVLSRLYEELLGNRDELGAAGSPARALAQVQRWLSKISREEVIEYLRGRPVLFQAYEGFVQKLPVTMEASLTKLVDKSEWAKFIAVGC